MTRGSIPVAACWRSSTDPWTSTFSDARWRPDPLHASPRRAGRRHCPPDRGAALGDRSGLRPDEPRRRSRGRASRALLDLTTEIMTPFPAGVYRGASCLCGLADGTGALIARLHHSVADGVGGLRMAEIFLTLDAGGLLDTDLDAILCKWRAAACDRDLLMPLPPSGQRSPVPSVSSNRRRPNSHSSVRILHEPNARPARRSTPFAR